MIFVHKKSPTPIQHWDALRHGGANNLDAGIKGKFLVLWNVDIVVREGAWHYIFEFDARDSLQKSGLAQLMERSNGNGSAKFKDGTNWAEWLGEGWQIIDEHVRNEILKLAPVEPMDGIITGVRELPNWFPGSRQVAAAVLAH